MKHSALIAISIASLLAASVTDAAPGHTKGHAVKPFTPELVPGDYAWRPEVSPAGPVVVFVSLPDQVLYVYRNGVRIGRSTVSTGKPGKPTPTGAFTVLQKKVHHESSWSDANARLRVGAGEGAEGASVNHRERHGSRSLRLS
jgi:lipoprotein-anchoring transpeptidase ErfK/SrfK